MGDGAHHRAHGRTGTAGSDHRQPRFLPGRRIPPAVEPLLERLAEHHVAIATVAPGAPDPLPLLRMLDIGVGVCLGSDGIRDLWSPWGDADLLHRAGLLAWRSGFRRDEYIEAALSTTTTVGARALGLPERGPVVGARADLVLVPAEVVAEAVVAHPERTLVVKAGRPVAGGRRLDRRLTRPRPGRGRRRVVGGLTTHPATDQTRPGRMKSVSTQRSRDGPEMVPKPASKSPYEPRRGTTSMSPGSLTQHHEAPPRRTRQRRREVTDR